MARKLEDMNIKAKKHLEKTQASYDKQVNKAQKHATLEVGNLVWLNIQNFKMFEAFTCHLIMKYVGPYKMFYKFHSNVYILLLPTMFMAHPTFHVSKLKSFHKYKKNKDKKQAYHLRFDTIEHRFASEVECTMGVKETRSLGKQYIVKWK